GRASRVRPAPPADGTRVRGPLTQITLDFNDNVLLTSLDPSDLTVNGVPAVAVTALDGDTVRFTLPSGLGEGFLNVALVGQVLDVQGTPAQPFTLQLFHDITPPRVIASSLQPNAILPTGGLTATITFSEAMRTANLDASDFSLVGQLTGAKTPVSGGFSYNAAGTVLTLTYANLPEDRYTLTLLSGDGRFEDTASPNGWNLDGGPSFPLPSGDGLEGGNFVVTFDTDAPAAAAFPTPLTARLPVGSLVYDRAASGVNSSAADTDSFTLAVDPGQRISLLVTPLSAGLQPTV